MIRLGKKPTSLILIVLIIFLSFSTNALAQNDKPDPDVTAASMTADAIFLRPVGFVTCILGSALFLVSLPFSALGNNADKAYETLVVRPTEYTFKRPLGEM